MWSFLGPGMEPVSPALAGGFLTTGHQGSPPQALNEVLGSFRSGSLFNIMPLVPLSVSQSPFRSSAPMITVTAAQEGCVDQHCPEAMDNVSEMTGYRTVIAVSFSGCIPREARRLRSAHTHEGGLGRIRVRLLPKLSFLSYPRGLWKSLPSF